MKSPNLPINIVFMGTPQFSVPCLQALIDHPDINIVAVLTQPDRPSGRGQKLMSPPVKVLAESAGLSVYQPTKLRTDDELIARLAELNADFHVTIAFGQILPQSVLDIPKQGTVNVHASLLPKYRGANPIQQSILCGEDETGLTTMLTEIGVDTGPMLLVHREAIEPTDTTEAMHDKLSNAAGDLLIKTLLGMADGSVTPTPQDDDLATHAPKLTKDAAAIDWHLPAKVIDLKIRGQHPWPGTVTQVNGQPLKLTASSLLLVSEQLPPSTNKNTPGSVIGLVDQGLLVLCGDGQPVVIHRVQPAGKKVMDASAWFNGLQRPDNLLLGEPLGVV